MWVSLIIKILIFQSLSNSEGEEVENPLEVFAMDRIVCRFLSFSVGDVT